MCCARATGRAKGFTLVEMLVVLAIMGILLGLVSTSVRPGARDVLRLEAERLAQLLDLAADESRITGKQLAWTSDGSAYRFWRLGPDDEWSPVRDSDELRARSLPQGMLIRALRTEAAGAQAQRRLEFSPGGQFLAYTIDVSYSGEGYTLSASPVGELQVAPSRGGAPDAIAPR